MRKKHLIAVVGPTAVGKTAMAIQLAQHFSCEILSADSRQFYKEMNIGTAKPNQAELNSVPHHFINSLQINEDYSAGKYETEALELLNKLFQKNDFAIVVGGSGLFINALTEGLNNIPTTPKAIREQLNQELETKGLTAMADELAIIDPVYHAQIDLKNKHRVLRALEVFRTSGEKLSDLQQREELSPRPFQTIFIGLEVNRTLLYEQINLRVNNMLEKGLLDEVEKLKSFKNLNPLKTVGYQEFYEREKNNQSLEEAIELVKRNSRRYAKRQLTWFKKNTKITWFKPTDILKITSHIKALCEASK